MVDFVTLFLGLVVGAHAVEVGVGAGVARVELLLDGEPAAVLEAPTWRGDVDFGEELVPHVLVAVARDAEGDELGRARQLVNAPRDLAEATLSLEPGSGGRGRIARLSWRSTEHSHPIAVSVTFDGRPLEIGDLHRIALPAFDPAVPHLLRADLTFSELVQVRAELTLGIDSELSLFSTAVAVESDGRPPRAAAMEGWLNHRDRALRVLAVEQGVLDVLVVREKSEILLGNKGDLGLLSRLFETSRPTARRSRTGARLDDIRSLRFADGDSLRFAFPTTEISSGDGASLDVVPVSLNVADLGGGDFRELVSRYLFPEEDIPTHRQRVADAVAVAGVRVAARHRVRAVVLILGGDTEDASRFSPQQVRRFLAALRVPLFVWAPVDTLGAEPYEGWGEVEDISKGSAFLKAIQRLRRHLERQAIIWVEGDHPPHEIELAPEVTGLELAG